MIGSCIITHSLDLITKNLIKHEFAKRIIQEKQVVDGGLKSTWILSVQDVRLKFLGSKGFFNEIQIFLQVYPPKMQILLSNFFQQLIIYQISNGHVRPLKQLLIEKVVFYDVSNLVNLLERGYSQS